MIERREFIAGFAGAAAWPLVAWGQQPGQMRRIGVFMSLAEDDPETLRRLAACVYSRPVDKTTGLRCDQTVRLTGVKSPDDYPQYLRYVVFYDQETDKRLGFFTNNFELPALVIAQLYRCRWQVELFFKWIKQHLRIKAFFGTNENAVKTQIWIAISVYVLVAIVKKRLAVEASLYTILQILSLTLFEKTPIDQLLNDADPQNLDQLNPIQLTLFD
jgi:hypothetical protein